MILVFQILGGDQYGNYYGIAKSALILNLLRQPVGRWGVGGEMRQRKKSIFTCHGNIRRSTWFTIRWPHLLRLDVSNFCPLHRNPPISGKIGQLSRGPKNAFAGYHKHKSNFWSQVAVKENHSYGSKMGWTGDFKGGQPGQGQWSTVCCGASQTQKKASFGLHLKIWISMKGGKRFSGPFLLNLGGQGQGQG